MIKIINILRSLDKCNLDLYSSLIGDVKLVSIDEYDIIVSKNNMNFSFNEFGQFNYCGILSPECLLFVKGKSWGELLKSTLKNGDLLIRKGVHEFDVNITEFEYYYIADIDNDKVYSNINGPVKLSDIDIDGYHILDTDSDEANEFFNYIAYNEIFDSPYSQGMEIYNSIINNLFEGNKIKLSDIHYNYGKFTFTISINDSQIEEYCIDLNNRY